MPAVFTPETFERAQAMLGLSDRALAAMLGCSAQHIRRMKVKDFAAGAHRPVSETTARLLAAYLDGYRPSDWPKYVSDEA